MSTQTEAMNLALEVLETVAKQPVGKGTVDAITALQAALAEQPAQQEPVAEVKAKMTGGNVGIATVIHEIYSPLREPLQPGDKLYSAYRRIGWDVEQVWSERIFGIDMRFENVQDAIAFRKKLDEATTPQAQPAPEIAIADAYRAGVDSGIAAERKACARVVEGFGESPANALTIRKGGVA